MSRKIQLSIADPCHENWDNMTQADKGRFCAACQKQVIDFTNMSDSQLAAFFKKPGKESVCGRFYNDQLGRNIEIPRKRIPWIKYFFQFALPAFLVSMKATAQGNVKAKPDISTSSAPVCSRLMGQVAPVPQIKMMGDTIMTSIQNNKNHSLSCEKRPMTTAKETPMLNPIKGVVIDEENNPIPFASVTVKGTTHGVMSDAKGNFVVDNSFPQQEITLEVSSVGYETKEISVSGCASNGDDLVIRLHIRAMGEVVVIGYGTVKGKVAFVGAVSVMTKKNIPDTLINTPTEIPSMIKVYPNPVVSGTSINVGCQKLKEGYYSIQLTNQAGQLVLSKQVWIDDGVQVLNVDLPHTASGVYFLKLTNKETNKRFTQKVVIE